MLNQARLTIRPLERSDVPAMLGIIRDARAEYGLGTRVESLLEPADLALYDTYQRQRALYSVALLDGEVVGGAGVAPLAGADPLTCELQRMYLSREARGRGIGTRLLHACLEAAQTVLVRALLRGNDCGDGPGAGVLLTSRLCDAARRTRSHGTRAQRSLAIARAGPRLNAAAAHSAGYVPRSMKGSASPISAGSRPTMSRFP